MNAISIDYENKHKRFVWWALFLKSVCDYSEHFNLPCMPTSIPPDFAADTTPNSTTKANNTTLSNFILFFLLLNSEVDWMLWSIFQSLLYGPAYTHIIWKCCVICECRLRNPVWYRIDSNRCRCVWDCLCALELDFKFPVNFCQILRIIYSLYGILCICISTTPLWIILFLFYRPWHLVTFSNRIQ